MRHGVQRAARGQTTTIPWLAACLGALLMLLSGCGGEGSGAPVPNHPDTLLFRAIEPDRVRLIDAFASYDDEARVTEQLIAGGLLAERSMLSKAPSGRYPPRTMVTLKVKLYRHQGELGSLTLEFFNNRLMEAQFYPEDVTAYAKALRRSVPNLPRGNTGTSEWVSGNLRVFSNVDLAKSKVGINLRTKGFALWQDIRLVAQRDEWDSRFGAIPEPAN